MNLFKAQRIIIKLNKHMKNNHRLKQHMDIWLEEEFGTDDENELLRNLKNNPKGIITIAEHYDKIKDKY